MHYCDSIELFSIYLYENNLIKGKGYPDLATKFLLKYN